MKLPIHNQIVLIVIIASLAVLVAACGSSTESTNDTPDPTSTVSVSDPQPASGSGDAEAGQKLFRSEGCSACHRTSGDRLVGPGLAGISTRGDDAYIRESLKDPGAVVVDGYPNVMSNFSRLSDEKVDNLIAYLKTLD